jgi:hypothetical protein
MRSPDGEGWTQDFQSWTRYLEVGTPNRNPVTGRVSVGAVAQVTPWRIGKLQNFKPPKGRSTDDEFLGR